MKSDKPTSKPAPSGAIPQHKKLAQGIPVDTGGSNAKPTPTRW